MDAQTRLPELNLHLNGCGILSSFAHTRTTLITFQHMLPAVLMGAGEWWVHWLSEGEGGQARGGFSGKAGRQSVTSHRQTSQSSQEQQIAEQRSGAKKINIEGFSPFSLTGPLT